MSLDSAPGTTVPAPLPLQFVHIDITPLMGGKFSVAMQATLLDEAELHFVAEDLVSTRVDTIDDAIAIIRQNVSALVPL